MYCTVLYVLYSTVLYCMYCTVPILYSTVRTIVYYRKMSADNKGSSSSSTSSQPNFYFLKVRELCCDRRIDEPAD